ncbi:tetratricopeptide repeat protein [Saccharospirillum alexandrii]|uniref:tetratricopeptide repeat protein n=1 Tax=Saccharospirillum alexandrii TaxID=2448477 RepID=UPI000FD8F7F3|nr:tetratricopeptide repeat protein [Saccharospirillum alexandrii]
MSLMHQALDQSAAPGQSRRSGYNPLQRSTKRAGVFWWIITLVALLMALVVLAWPHWRSTPGLLPPAPAQAAPSEESLAAPANTPMLAAAEPAPEPVQTTTMASPAASNQQSADQTPEPQPAPEPAEADSAPAPATTNADSPRVTPAVPATVEEPEATVSQPTPGPMAVDPPAARPPSPAPTPAKTEALPEPADTPTDPAGTARARPGATTAQSASSVATAVPQHASARQAVQTAIGQGNLEQAQQRLRAWINREPQLEEPRIWLAKLYLNQGGAEQAEALLIGLQSNEALGLRGLILEQSGRYADAARVFEALTREEASNPQWWLHWAINLENSGRLAEARLLYQTYLEQFSAHNARLTAFATERYRALAG